MGTNTKPGLFQKLANRLCTAFDSPPPKITPKALEETVKQHAKDLGGVSLGQSFDFSAHNDEGERIIGEATVTHFHNAYATVPNINDEPGQHQEAGAEKQTTFHHEYTDLEIKLYNDKRPILVRYDNFSINLPGQDNKSVPKNALEPNA